MLNITKRRGRDIGNGRRRVKTALIEAVEQRLLYSTTLTGKTTYSAGIETSGPFSVNSFILNQAWNHGHSGSAGYSDWDYLEFGSSGGLAPGGITVGDIDSITINLYNTAASGTFGGQPGNFSLYFAPDNNTDPSTLRYTGGVNNNAGATTTGFNVLKIAGNATQGQMGMSDGSAGYPASTKIGSATFSASDATSVGYHAYTFSNLSLAAKQGIANDLNTGKAVRVAVVPDDTNLLADWEGNFSFNYPTISVNVEEAVSAPSVVGLNASSYTVNKTDGTASFTVTRSIGTGFTDVGSTVSYATSDVTAVAGTNYTAESGLVTFAPGQTSATITVPILDPGHNAMNGDKTFSLTLSSPSANTTLDAGGTSATVKIVDTDVVTVSQYSNDNSTVQPGGVRPGATGKSYFNIAGSNAGTSASFGALDFNTGNFTFDLPGGKDVSKVVGLSVDTVQGYPASQYNASGPMNVYLVPDTTTSIQNDGTSPLFFDTGSLPSGLGTQLGQAVLLGTYNYSANEPVDVFTSHPLDTVDPTGAATLVQDLNNGTMFRIVVAPGNASAEASLEGQYTFNGIYEAPKLTFGTYVVDESTGPSLPDWVSPDSVATWDPSTRILNVTGATTIVANPDADDAPIIEASGAAAKVTIQPFSDKVIEVGGVELSNGASLDVKSVGAGRSASNHIVLGIGSGSFSVDASSTLDLEDNDLVLHNANGSTESAVAQLIGASSLFSSTAVSNGSTTLGFGLNDGSEGYSYSTFGPASVSSTDLLVKYTYFGDADLNGKTDNDDYLYIDSYFPSSHSFWSQGDFDHNGQTNNDDYLYIDSLFGTTTDVL